MDWVNMRFSAAWAAKRQERLEAVLGKEKYRDLEAVVLWGLGARVQDVQAVRGLGRSSLYEHIAKVLDGQVLSELATDGGDDEVAEASIEPALATRIVELLVGQCLSAGEIRDRLGEQDGTRLSDREVAFYLSDAGLEGYEGSRYRDQALPGAKEAELGTFTRYAVHLLSIPALNALGYERVMPLLDVTKPRGYYSHFLRINTILLGLSAGKRRLYHNGELVEDEFATMLGSDRYPKRSDLHAYLDRIVERDQAEAKAGVPQAERVVARFTQESQEALAKAAGLGAGKEVYLDTHTIALHTEKAVAQTKHGIWNRVVKALVKMRSISATHPGRALTFSLEQGDVSLVSHVEGAIKGVECATGEQVEMVGVDRGAFSQEVLEAFDGSDTGLAVWAGETTVLRREVAAIPKSTFVDGEYESIRRSDGKKVRRLKTRLADIPGMVINSRGYRCRTVVVEDVRNGHRAALHAVGQPAQRQSAQELLSFLRGKQWVEEDFKQGRAWGSDAFCGGKITQGLRREKPVEKEIEGLMLKARKLKRRWKENIAEEGIVVARWQAGELRKRHLNDLLKGIRRRRKQIEADWKEAEGLICWGRTGIVPKSQIRWVVDTRKMTLLAQFLDFIRQARRDTLTQLRQCMEQALVEETVADRGGIVEKQELQFIQGEVQKAVKSLPWGQLSVRLFDQGGWIRKDAETRVMHVTLKSFGPRLVQKACERLCDHLNSLAAVMHCEDGDYTLHYACQPRPPS
ncbi:MAG TPA: hypothetical protein EYP71_03750 [Dehalococcoidia bacterium]|nr:hypothetical protein [Dehalococcoidia bacterium]